MKKVIEEINKMTKEEIKIMEVCGTHTQMISKLGLRPLLSRNIKLVSGPGCPVCVTVESYIDIAIELLKGFDVTVVTFGDLVKVNGTTGSMREEKELGKDVRVIYNPLKIIEMAESDKDKNFVFLGVGFETTAPIIALTIKIAAEKGIENLYFLTSIKLMPPILHYIFNQPRNEIRGLICPGHVATIKGADYFRFIGADYDIPAAVCGFDTEDILTGIHYLVRKIINGEAEFSNLYRRCVKPKGNLVANKLIEDVFKISRGEWRGIGTVENSSLNINEKYAKFDAMKVFSIESKSVATDTICECKDILLGNKAPIECKLFGRVCNPITPYGPCMVSSEGACAIAYRYREDV